MPNFTVKLVDHTGSDASWKQGLRKEVQDLFDLLFAGSTGTIDVQWGEGKESDLIVLHFVADVEHSYIQEKSPVKERKEIKKYIGGHTSTRGGRRGSEVYKLMGPENDRKPRTQKEYAKLMLHESFHNQFPQWEESELNATGGLADSPPKLPPTQKNKEMMQVANTFKGKIRQLL